MLNEEKKKKKKPAFSVSYPRHMNCLGAKGKTLPPYCSKLTEASPIPPSDDDLNEHTSL